MRFRLLLPCLAMLAIASSPVRARAQSIVHQCMGADGELIYSDKPCVAFDATDRTVPHASLPGSTMSLGRQAVRAGCARTLDDLVHEITLAFDTADPNRLIGVYHWPGLATGSGYDIADRLARLTRDPLIDAQVGDGGVRLLLARGKAGSTVRVDFHLRRYRDCWWLSY